MTEQQTVAAARTAAELRIAASGSESPRLDAEILLGEVTGLDRAGIIAHPERPLSADEATAFEVFVARREAHEPVAYIIGYAPFRHLNVAVTHDVLIPRPETELLVDVALAAINEQRANHPDTVVHVLDIGTGSGAIAVAVASEAPSGSAAVTALDLSPDALAVAQRNADLAGVSVELLQGDLTAPVAGRTFEVVLSNPPYLAEDEADSLMPDVVDHEPHLALFGGDEFLRRVVKEAVGVLAPGGTFAVEVAWNGADAMEQRLFDAGLSDIQRFRDVPGHERVVSGRLHV